MLELIGRASAQTLPTFHFVNQNISIQTVVVNTLQWMLVIVAAIAVVYLVYGGFSYITAGGDAEKATKGRTVIINAIIGIVIIVLAYTIVTWVSQLTNTIG